MTPETEFLRMLARYEASGGLEAEDVLTGRADVFCSAVFALMHALPPEPPEYVCEPLPHPAYKTFHGCYVRESRFGKFRLVGIGSPDAARKMGEAFVAAMTPRDASARFARKVRDKWGALSPKDKEKFFTPPPEKPRNAKQAFKEEKRRSWAVLPYDAKSGKDEELFSIDRLPCDQARGTPGDPGAGG